MIKMENKQAVKTEELAPEIRDFLTKQSKQKVKEGVDFLQIIRKIKKRKAEKNG